MKAIMISIQPRHCENICTVIGEENGKPVYKKTVEVRKKAPKCDIPFKCYIYCTQNQFVARKSNGEFWFAKRDTLIQPNDSVQLSGKVIGEFVCDRVELLFNTNGNPANYMKEILPDILQRTALSYKEFQLYTNNRAGKNSIYGWHISDLKIYDKPKELEYFYKWKKCNSCKRSGYEATACVYDIDCKVPARITRPPQSWGYVEEL